MPTFKEMFTAAIERTGNPLAPIILQNAHSGCEKLGKLMVPLANAESVQAYAERILKDFPTDNETYASDPSFIVALASMLAVSIERYVGRF